jgi:hypothetical protein
MFMTENPVAVSLLATVVQQHNTTRTLVFPTGTPLGVPTDAGQYQRDGVPVASLISGPTWLFDDDDTLRKRLAVPSDRRMWNVFRALDRGWTVEQVHEATKIDAGSSRSSPR